MWKKYVKPRTVYQCSHLLNWTDIFKGARGCSDVIIINYEQTREGWGMLASSIFVFNPIL